VRKLIPAVIAAFMLTASYAAAEDPRMERLKKEINAEIERARKECPKADLSIGMTKARVLSCWGQPRRTRSIETASGVREQWAYYGLGIYFEHGVVVAIEKGALR
jgi:hypothetical protein